MTAVYNPSLALCAFSVPGHGDVGIYQKDAEFDSKETLILFPPLPLVVAERFSNLIGVVNGALCIDFATPFASKIYVLCNITNSTFRMIPSIQPTSDKSIVISGFGYNSVSGNQSIVRMWKDYLYGLHSSISVYDTSSLTWSPIEQPICDVSQIFDSYVHVNGVRYWIALKETTVNPCHKKLLIAYNGVVGLITWKSTMEYVNDYVLYVKSDTPNGASIFHRVKRLRDVLKALKFLTYRNGQFVFHSDDNFCVDVSKGVTEKDMFIFPQDDLCNVVKIFVPRPQKFVINGVTEKDMFIIVHCLNDDFINRIGTGASSGIASQLIPGGRTAHSRFAIPLNIDGNSTCHIVQGSDLAELMVHTKLIIWDEAAMTHRHCFEALDRSLRDIMHSQNAALAKHPFGGKVVVLGSDFRQILPVIPRASREDIVLASLNSSYLWPSCKVLSLTKNMRLYQGYSVEENSSISRFAEWIFKVGDGNIGNIINDEEHEITIDDDILIDDAEDLIKTIVESTYPKLVDSFKNHVYFRERAILSPTLDDVAQVNEFMLGLLPGEERTYLSSDAICNQDPEDELAEVYTTEFLNTICGSCLPYHQLKLKVGAPIMLLRNIDRSMGLCNGTRLILTRMCEHVIEASIMSGKFAGEKVLIARMLISPSNYKLPFKFQRRQFPVVLSFSMTINKSQEQTLSNVGIYLPRPVFSHGQLSVAASHVRRRSGLKILVTDANHRQMRTTTNVVFKEIFQNVK
ncbi:ATP-dependent DNA helicase PIF1-like [Senna tora]|uniref:ATP-dependent DNA helicase n=1 Tax=Senna tora TaxID=362788 RepID=A0A834SQA5_9FABA|nr:ATP-dependent DNA helicase PIF1-like [Senna tora]